jgi:hypothetical protein
MSTLSGSDPFEDWKDEDHPEVDWLVRKTVAKPPSDSFSRVRRFRLKDEPWERRQGGQPVLLVHAAVTGYRMFLEPDRGFLGYLLEQKDAHGRPFDVWALDWRSSNLLARDDGAGVVDLDHYRMEQAVEDLQYGVKEVYGATTKPVHVVAHCMGAAATAQAIAMNAFNPGALGNVVLTTIALFYQQGLDGWLKVLEQILQDLPATRQDLPATRQTQPVPVNLPPLPPPSPKLYALSPHADGYPGLAWPPSFERLFQEWKRSMYPHGCGDAFCDRLWFMFGADYRAEDMMQLHDGEGAHGLAAHFGAMPLGLYQHIEQNCNRGWAAPYLGDKEIGKLLERDLASAKEEEAFREQAETYVSAGAARHFAGVDLTLIAPEEGQVWHRESIDRMYEWLQRHHPRSTRHRKRVFERFGHIDLWWSSKAREIVYPYILQQLARDPPAT